MDNDILKGHRKRLKERFSKVGLTGFHDYEVLELLLSYCIPRKDVKPIAKELIIKFKKISSVLEAPKEMLEETNGVGESTALFLKLVNEVGVKSLKEKIIGKAYINSCDDIISFCKKSMGGLRYEVFQVLFLSINGELIAAEEINQGTLTQAVVYPRKILERAFYHNASILVLVHNHPAGSLIPSSLDLEITKKIQAVAKTVEISIWDHLIITNEGFLSLKDSGFI